MFRVAYGAVVSQDDFEFDTISDYPNRDHGLLRPRRRLPRLWRDGFLASSGVMFVLMAVLYVMFRRRD